MWDVTVATFKDDVLCSKIYKALHHAHQSAFNAAVADTKPVRDLERVEAFTKQWIENTVGRVWQSVDDLDQAVTRDTVVRLFQNLVAPFGEEHPFSCVPAALTRKIGRPPRDWDVIKETIKQLFLAWKTPNADIWGQVVKKKRRSGG